MWLCATSKDHHTTGPGRGQQSEPGVPCGNGVRSSSRDGWQEAVLYTCSGSLVGLLRIPLQQRLGLAQEGLRLSSLEVAVCVKSLGPLGFLHGFPQPPEVLPGLLFLTKLVVSHRQKCQVARNGTFELAR